MKRYDHLHFRSERELEEWLNTFQARIVFVEHLRSGDWFVITEVSRVTATRREFRAFDKRVSGRVTYWIEYYWTRLRAIPRTWKTWLRERLA